MLIDAIILVLSLCTNPMTPNTEKKSMEYTLHGKKLKDPYQWLENKNDPKVQTWTQKQNDYTLSHLDPTLLQALEKRFDELLRYDDKTPKREVRIGMRKFFYKKKKEEDRWKLFTELEGSEVELINPNLWEETSSLDVASFSPDGKYLAFGIAHGGDENPIIQIMEVSSKKILPDSLKGWKQAKGWKEGATSWLPDSSGFYYSAHPLEEEAPHGEKDYWQAVYFHKIGTDKTEDRKIFFSDKDKNCYHHAQTNSQGDVLFFRYLFSRGELFIQPAGEKEILAVAQGFDADYDALVLNDQILIHTDLNAPLYQVYSVPKHSPQKENWTVWLAEDKEAKLLEIVPIGGKIYAHYLKNASSEIRVFDEKGRFLKTVDLPAKGTVTLRGHFTKPKVHIGFQSFCHPYEEFLYDFEKNTLSSIYKKPLPAHPEKYQIKQVWYPSKDGTPISIFLIGSNFEKNKNRPILLTGYGGFNISLTPSFSETYLLWLEATDGIIAIPNLRGGGEYGAKWHEAGMFEKKQNVFDDFIAAAEYLIENELTSSSYLAIAGGSNGGLLVGAALTQRPDLFACVLCRVPLLDMIRYHHFGIANIWSSEYGNADDPHQFSYLLKYSPYHRVTPGEKYPATLITAGENDARVDPCHAYKMVALLQEISEGSSPIFLLNEKNAGHRGGATLSLDIKTRALHMGFLLTQLNIKWP